MEESLLLPVPSRQIVVKHQTPVSRICGNRTYVSLPNPIEFYVNKKKNSRL